jgi:hypothetical protein
MTSLATHEKDGAKAGRTSFSSRQLDLENTSSLTHRTLTSTMTTDSDHSTLGQSCFDDLDDGQQDDSSLNVRRSLDFVGRSEFIQALNDLFVQQTTPSPSSPISVVIQGTLASGKTRLLQEMSRHKRYCIWVSFMCHDKDSHPYSAIFKGLNLFLREFLRDRRLNLSQSVIQQLQLFIPCLRDYLDHEQVTMHTPLSMPSLDQIDGALLHIIRCTFQQIETDKQESQPKEKETQVRPKEFFSIFLLIDDLQHSTLQARKFIQRIQQTCGNKPFILVATCHIVHGYSDPLASWLLHQKQAGALLKRLPNWSYDDVARVIQKNPAWANDSCLKKVAQVVYKRTNGHAGSVLALLRVARAMNYNTASSIASIPVPRVDSVKEDNGLTQARSRRDDDAAVMRHLVKLQYSALPESVRISLQVAAVYLPLFGAESIAFLVRKPPEIVHHQLHYACERGLL